jgi:hypothetical protein
MSAAKALIISAVSLCIALHRLHRCDAESLYVSWRHLIPKNFGKNKQIAKNISVPGVPGLFTCPGWDMGQCQFAVAVAVAVAAAV